MLRNVFCKLGFHQWSPLGLAQYGRGQLYKCKRKGCKKSKCVPLSIDELKEILEDQVEDVLSRAEVLKADEATSKIVFETSEPGAAAGTYTTSTTVNIKWDPFILNCTKCYHSSVQTQWPGFCPYCHAPPDNSTPPAKYEEEINARIKRAAEAIKNLPPKTGQ